MPQPQATRVILGDRQQLDAAQARKTVFVQPLDAAVRSQAFDHAVEAAQPEAAGTCWCQRAVHRALQAVRRAGVLRDPLPVRAQVTQAEAGDRHPQRTIVLLQQGTDPARDVRPAGAHRFRRCIPALPPQPALAGDPASGIARAGDVGHRIRTLEHRRPCRLRPLPMPIAMPHAMRGAYPQAIAARDQRIHQRRLGFARQRHALDAPVAQARKTGIGADPQRARCVDREFEHGVRRQALRDAIAHDAAIRADGIQAALVGAEPDRVALPREGPGIVALQLRMAGLAVVAEAAPLRIQHADPATFHRQPDAVVGTDHQFLDVVAGQALRIGGIVAPHAHADAVVTRQSVRGGDPQVAVGIARQRTDLGRRQPLRRADDAEARTLRHRRQCASAQQPQPQQCGEPARHPDPPLPACWQRNVACASTRARPARPRIRTCPPCRACPCPSQPSSRRAAHARPHMPASRRVT